MENTRQKESRLRRTTGKAIKSTLKIKMEQISNKVERYIQLSKKFQKTAVDIFCSDCEPNTISFMASGNCVTGYYQQDVIVKEKTRAEKIRETAEITEL